jgi:hypothetical protein
MKDMPEIPAVRCRSIFTRKRDIAPASNAFNALRRAPGYSDLPWNAETG